MRVYADLFFLLNAVADLVLLAVAGRLAGLPLRAGRLCAAAAFGGGYGLAAVLRPSPLLFGAPGALLAAALMLALAFAPLPPRVFLRALALFYGTAALLAGLVYLLSWSAAAAGAGVPWWALALGLGGCLAGGALTWDRWRPEARARWYCDLEVELGGRRVTCRALVDTGNGLRDPWGGGPAVVVDAVVLRGLLPGRLLACLAGADGGLPVSLAEAAAGVDPGGGWSRRLRFIPFRTVGDDAGLLCAIKPDALRLRVSGRWFAVRAVVGVSPRGLDPEAGYQALVPAGLVAVRDGAARVPRRTVSPSPGRRRTGTRDAVRGPGRVPSGGRGSPRDSLGGGDG